VPNNGELHWFEKLGLLALKNYHGKKLKVWTSPSSGNPVHNPRHFPRRKIPFQAAFALLDPAGKRNAAGRRLFKFDRPSGTRLEQRF
jgi:hypothetical protein